MMTLYYLFLSTWPALTIAGLVIASHFKPKGERK